MKKSLTHRESNIVATVKSEMEEARLTESVRSEQFDHAEETARSTVPFEMPDVAAETGRHAIRAAT
jgi:hypothetical protein